MNIFIKIFQFFFPIFQSSFFVFLLYLLGYFSASLCLQIAFNILIFAFGDGLNYLNWELLQWPYHLCLVFKYSHYIRETIKKLKGLQHHKQNVLALMFLTASLILKYGLYVRLIYFYLFSESFLFVLIKANPLIPVEAKGPFP